MSDRGLHVTEGEGLPPGLPASEGPPRDCLRALLYGLLLVLVVAFAVHPLRTFVEAKRQALMGRSEPPGRRLALASQFGFDAAAGDSMRLVPGAPVTDIEDLPGEAVTLILGGFRGPYVVWLWTKVEDEKQKKIHFDLLDRYSKIASLQSDYPEVWTFHYWNMLWNITVQWQSAERKYQWIRLGIRFLKEGYRHNPHSADIMLEMGRGYLYKIGHSQESPYYLKRVKEDEGRSAFLAAYEWFDRARKANDRYGTLHDPKAVSYSQACHALSYYAIETTQETHDEFARSLDARTAGREDESRTQFQAAEKRLAEAIGAWQWTSREWQDHASRFEKEHISPDLLNKYRKFFGEADQSAKLLESIRSELTYKNLPDVMPKIPRPEIAW
ncbi:MAG: hypothetical protein NTY65_13045 [Planctomycetota bacterium]|nr:hypothetical protein [Planctomycetota bacterium]